MSTLTYNPTPEIFSQVPLLDDVYHEFNVKNTLKLIEQVGQIFVKYNYYEKFGLSMVHRHFEMSDKEILVESINKDKTVSVFVPWVISPGTSPLPSDMDLWKSYGMENSEKKFIIPQNWVFNSKGEAIPFEFFATDDKTLLSTPSADFTKELYDALKQLGVAHIVGLRNLEHNKTKTWETTPENIRVNVVAHGERPKEMDNAKMIKVVWRFDAEGKMSEGKANCVFCSSCNHCNHCGTCTH